MREKLNALIIRQHELGRKRSESAQAEYLSVTLEILALARSGIDLNPDWKPANPMPARKNIETVQDLAEAKSRLARLEAEGGPGWMDEYRDLQQQIRAVERIILDRAQREGVAA